MYNCFLVFKIVFYVFSFDSSLLQKTLKLLIFYTNHPNIRNKINAPRAEEYLLQPIFAS